MIDPQSAAALQDVIRRESRSLLQYVSESYPWARYAEIPALTELGAMIEEEGQSTAALARYLQKGRYRLPYLPAYPDFTGINFVSLEYLLPLLVTQQKKLIAGLEADLEKIKSTEVRSRVQKHLEMKRRHLLKLEGLASPKPESVGSPG